MNPSEMPDGTIQAEDMFQKELEAAEQLYEQRAAMFPLEDFRDKALLNMFAEDDYECLLQLREMAPTQMLVLLLKAVGKAELLPCGGKGLNDDPALLGQWFEEWVADEQERLQADQIEASR